MPKFSFVFVLVLAGCSAEGASSYTTMTTRPDADAGTDAILPPPRLDVRSITLGGQQTCARLEGDVSVCLGDVPVDDVARLIETPRRFDFPGGLVVEFALGDAHACARLDDGTVECFGENRAGQLGDGTTDSRREPVAALGIDDAIAIGARGDVTCAVRRGGDVLCWGALSMNDELVTTPSETSLTGASAVAVGRRHVCALGRDGRVSCFGENARGQLATGDIGRIEGAALIAIEDVVSLSAGGEHTCALDTRGTVSCWGSNGFGQIGDGTNGDALAPVATLENVAQLSVGEDHSCARTTAGDVTCWGRNNRGQIGDGTFDSRREPAFVDGAIESIAAGRFATCAIAGGRARCWGENSFGQLGNGSREDQPIPTALSAL